jgi:hypothetical protein
VKAGFNAALLVLKDEKPDVFNAFADYINKKITAEEFRSLPFLKQYDNSWERKLTPAELLAIRRNDKSL